MRYRQYLKTLTICHKKKKETFEQLLKAHISGDKKKVEELEKKLKEDGE
jgi:hypothetical protein